MIGQKEITLSSILDCVYCKRRYYLRSVERQEDINAYMELGKEEHEQVDKSSIKYDSGKYTVTNMTVYSDKYNLYGINQLISCSPLFVLTFSCIPKSVNRLPLLQYTETVYFDNFFIICFEIVNPFSSISEIYLSISVLYAKIGFTIMVI